MRHLVELVERLAAHALGGRVRRAQLGMLGLDVAQLVEERVVFRVGDLRLVEDVVAVAVVLELPAQLLGPAPYVRGATQRPRWRDAADARDRSPRAPRRPPGR